MCSISVFSPLNPRFSIYKEYKDFIKFLKRGVDKIQFMVHNKSVNEVYEKHLIKKGYL